MLLKWAVEGKRRARLKQIYPSIDQQIDQHDDNCSGGVSETSSSSLNAAEAVPADQDTTSAARHLESSNALNCLESEGERGLQRAEAEDKARSLRDSKLLAAGSVHSTDIPDASLLQAHTSASRVPPAAALTEENISQLHRAHDEAGTSGPTLFPPPTHVASRLGTDVADNRGHHYRNKGSGDYSSMAAQGRDSDSEAGSTVGSLRNLSLNDSNRDGTSGGAGAGGIRGWMRRGLSRNDSDRSQATVTQGNFARGREGAQGSDDTGD